MGIKKRNKVSAEFSMSSLTDIIFLLLIFFMLTSSLVAPNSLNLKLPGSKSSNTASTEDIDDVRITKSGKFRFNGKTISFSNLSKTLASRSKRKRNYTMTISPDKGTPTQHVARIMDLALKYRINGILATDVK